MKLRDGILAGEPRAYLFLASQSATHADAVAWAQDIHRRAGVEVPDARTIDALIYEGETLDSPE